MRHRLNRLSKSIYVNTAGNIEQEVAGEDNANKNFDALTERSFTNSMGPMHAAHVYSKSPLGPQTTAKKSRFDQTSKVRATLTNVDLNSFSLQRQISHRPRLLLQTTQPVYKQTDSSHLSSDLDRPALRKTATAVY